MLRYQETIEQSAEYLRLAIPLMSRQPVAFHPISYCVWYEYVAGINRPLKVAIDEMVKAGKTLDEKTTEALFGTYIAGRDQNVAQRVTSGFSKVMSDISRDAANVGEHAHRFGNTLEQWTEEQEQDWDILRRPPPLRERLWNDRWGICWGLKTAQNLFFFFLLKPQQPQESHHQHDEQ